MSAASALKSVCGIDNAFMHGVAPLKPGQHMAGPAYTLRYIPARADLDERTDMPHGGIANSVTDPVEFNLTDPQRVAVEALQPGDVFVIDARGETRCGTMGAILATRMAMRGCIGFVTDGCYRDTPEICRLEGVASYAGAMNAQTNKTYHHPSEIQVPISCGEVAVVPGDIIVGDEEGIMVIPAAVAEKVAELAFEHETHEAFILEKIRCRPEAPPPPHPSLPTASAFQRRLPVPAGPWLTCKALLICRGQRRLVDRWSVPTIGGDGQGDGGVDGRARGGVRGTRTGRRLQKREGQACVIPPPHTNTHTSTPSGCYAKSERRGGCAV